MKILAKAGDELAKDHYREAGASRRRVRKLRPLQQTLSFHVDQMVRMKEIKEYFGM